MNWPTIPLTKSYVFKTELLPPHHAECTIEALLRLSQPLGIARFNLQVACMIANDERKIRHGHGVPLDPLLHLVEAEGGKLSVRWRASALSSSHLDEHGRGGGGGAGWGGVEWYGSNAVWPVRSLEVAQVEQGGLGKLAMGEHLSVDLYPILEKSA